jgi:hypothetical protein
MHSIETKQRLEAFCELLQIRFPERLRSVYLVGSYSSGREVQASDIDIIAVFRFQVDSREKVTTQHLAMLASKIAGVRFDIHCTTDRLLSTEGSELIKLNSKLLWGEDLSSIVVMPRLKDYQRRTSMAALRSILRVRAGLELHTLPLSAPDPSCSYLGYEFSGSERPLHSIVSIVSDIAKATVGYLLEEYVGIKEKNLKLLQKTNTPNASLSQEIYVQCRNNWNLLLPKRASERRWLREAVDLMPAMETHFIRNVAIPVLAEPTNLTSRPTSLHLAGLPKIQWASMTGDEN